MSWFGDIIDPIKSGVGSVISPIKDEIVAPIVNPIKEELFDPLKDGVGSVLGYSGEFFKRFGNNVLNTQDALFGGGLTTIILIVAVCIVLIALLNRKKSDK